MTSFHPPSSSSRPFPPPCWSQDETVSLIDAYRDKWYSLRRGNLRASDWQDVADDVANRSSGNPRKTSTQCRHKMEKLRKRYRVEIQRAAATPNGRRYSSWIHFKQMDSMENGSNASNTSSDQVTVSMYRFEDEELEERDCYIKQANPNPNPNPNTPNQRFYNSIDRGNGLNWGKPSYGDNPVKEMVGAINKLGDGFVRIERMKMEMAREIELMRLEMEMKRTEMIVESYQRFADSFLDRVNKKLKRMHTPES